MLWVSTGCGAIWEKRRHDSSPCSGHTEGTLAYDCPETRRAVLNSIVTNKLTLKKLDGSTMQAERKMKYSVMFSVRLAPSVADALVPLRALLVPSACGARPDWCVQKKKALTQGPSFQS